MQKAEDLKKQGNEAFVGQNYKTAEQLYSEALQLQPDHHILYGNRSAARYHLEMYDQALQDALKSTELCNDWAKGYYRQGCALEALRKFRLAQRAFEESIKLDTTTNKQRTLKRIVALKKLADREEQECKITDQEHWISIYSNLDDTRLRLAILVYYWNRSTRKERYAIFLKFLQVLADGGTVPSISKYNDDHMLELPIQNYENVKLPENWTNFYDALSLAEKVKTFEDMYAAANEMEKNLIINDMKTFLLNPTEVKTP